MLIERSGELVMRAEITDALWPQDLDVDVEQGLNHCIKEIRAALGDKAESPRYVQTLPRRGYRMLAEVQGLRGLPTAGPSDEVTVPAPVAGSGLREAPGNEDDEPVGFGKGFE